MIHAFVLREDEAEAFVKVPGGVEDLDMDGERFGGALGLFLQFAEKMSADALAAKFGQKGDVHDADLLFPMIDVKAACGLVFDLDDEVLRRGVVLAVVAGLSLELLGAKGGLLVVGPVRGGKFGYAGAGVDGEEEGRVGFGGGAEGE